MAIRNPQSVDGPGHRTDALFVAPAPPLGVEAGSSVRSEALNNQYAQFLGATAVEIAALDEDALNERLVQHSTLRAREAWPGAPALKPISKFSAHPVSPADYPTQVAARTIHTPPEYAQYQALPQGMQGLLTEADRARWDSWSVAQRKARLDEVLPPAPQYERVAQLPRFGRMMRAAKKQLHGLREKGERALDWLAGHRGGGSTEIPPDVQRLLTDADRSNWPHWSARQQNARLGEVLSATTSVPPSPPPATVPSPSKLKDRTLHAFYVVREKGHEVREQAQQWLSRSEYRTQHRAVVGVAVGAAALALMYLNRHSAVPQFIIADSFHPPQPGSTMLDMAPSMPSTSSAASSLTPSAPPTPRPEVVPPSAPKQPPVIPEAVAPPVPPDVPPLTVRPGETLWGVLQNAGVPPEQIMQRLDDAAQASGLPYRWAGEGTDQWLEVAGQSDTQSLVALLSPYIQR